LFVVEQDIASDPTDVGFFGADGIVFDSQLITDAVMQFPGFGLLGHQSPTSQLQDQKRWCILEKLTEKFLVLQSTKAKHFDM